MEKVMVEYDKSADLSAEQLEQTARQLFEQLEQTSRQLFVARRNEVERYAELHRRACTSIPSYNATVSLLKMLQAYYEPGDVVHVVLNPSEEYRTRTIVLVDCTIKRVNGIHVTEFSVLGESAYSVGWDTTGNIQETDSVVNEASNEMMSTVRSNLEKFLRDNQVAGIKLHDQDSSEQIKIEVSGRISDFAAEYFADYGDLISVLDRESDQGGDGQDN